MCSQFLGDRFLAEKEQVYQERFEELRRELLLGALEVEQGELLDATATPPVLPMPDNGSVY